MADVEIIIRTVVDGEGSVVEAVLTNEHEAANILWWSLVRYRAARWSSDQRADRRESKASEVARRLQVAVPNVDRMYPE